MRCPDCNNKLPDINTADIQCSKCLQIIEIRNKKIKKITPFELFTKNYYICKKEDKLVMRRR